MGKSYTAERLANIRRMRTARRLYKVQPLFAYALMLELYPEYGQDEFWEDLRLRKPSKKKKGKSFLVRYGRYSRMVAMLNRYEQTGNPEDALQVIRLQERMTKPYRVLVRVGGERIEYKISPLVPIGEIEGLVKSLSACKTETEADALVERLRQNTHGY